MTGRRVMVDGNKRSRRPIFWQTEPASGQKKGGDSQPSCTTKTETPDEFVQDHHLVKYGK